MPGDRTTPIGWIRPSRHRKTAPDTDAPGRIGVQPATLAETDDVASVLAEAFFSDPTWSWAFPDPAARLRYWRVCVAEALRYPWVLRCDGYEAVAVWIPPDGTEFSTECDARLPQLLADLAGPRAADVGELIRRFGEAHPRREPHYYLSLLGTADHHRGRGLGMALLRENLARVDAERMPAYLESSNPRNNHLYESVGFVSVTSFRAPGDGPFVTGMWRSSA